MSRRGCITIRASNLSEISFDLTTHTPDLGARPLKLEIFVNGVKLCAFSLYRYGWLELRIPVPQRGSATGEDFELEIRADRTWRPVPAEGTIDDRELSIAVCNLVVR